MRVAQPRPQTLRPTRIPPEYVSPGLYKRIQFVVVSPPCRYEPLRARTNNGKISRAARALSEPASCRQLRPRRWDELRIDSAIPRRFRRLPAAATDRRCTGIRWAATGAAATAADVTGTSITTGAGLAPGR